jgi:hypothetical protein
MPVSSLVWPLPKRRQEALSSFQGTLSHICPALRPRPDHRVRLLTLWCCSRRHKDESSSNHQSFEAQSHGFCTRCMRLRPSSLKTLQCSLPGSPPFPGGLSRPTGFLQRISTSGYPIVSFLSGFILTLYAGFELELAETERYREPTETSHRILTFSRQTQTAEVNTRNRRIAINRRGEPPFAPGYVPK